MLYGELPNVKIINKLMSVCFDSPAKNLRVYKFCNAIAPMVQYLESERVKMVTKHGVKKDDGSSFEVPQYKINDFFADYSKALEMEITDNIPPLGLTEADFGDNCIYSTEKEMWLNPSDIAGILAFSKKLENEKKG